jgi:hypothetical protein
LEADAPAAYPSLPMFDHCGAVPRYPMVKVSAAVNTLLDVGVR